MRHSIRFVLVMLLALSFGIRATGSASAQAVAPWGLAPTDPAQVGAQGEGAGRTAEKTFELTLTAHVP